MRSGDRDIAEALQEFLIGYHIVAGFLKVPAHFLIAIVPLVAGKLQCVQECLILDIHPVTENMDLLPAGALPRLRRNDVFTGYLHTGDYLDRLVFGRCDSLSHTVYRIVVSQRHCHEILLKGQLDQL